MGSTSPQKIIRSRVRFERGFSLIEIVVVLGLTALLITGAISVVALSADKRQVTESAGKVGAFAKRARAVAMVQQRPYALVFTQGNVRLMPLAEATGMDSGQSASSPNNASLASVHDGFQLDGNFQLSIRRWGTENWIPVNNDRVVQIWRFEPSGLCEPIGVRLAMNQSWIEDTYHPLSAGVELSDSYFP